MIELRQLPLGLIKESSFNPRRTFDSDGMANLIASIKQQGVLQPILVRPVDLHYEIVAGARRFRAATEADLDTIPAVVRNMNAQAALEAAVVENLQREDVHPLEEAEGYERLMKDYGYNADQLADKIGKSRAYIYARLKLLALAPHVRELFFEGKLDASRALLVARIPGAALQLKAAKEITTPDWKGDLPGYRASASIIQNNYTLQLHKASFDPYSERYAVGSCRDCPKRSGNDRVLFADIDSPDVCTDPACFNDKREVNYLRLRAIAEQSGGEVITGNEAQKLSNFHNLRQHNLEPLDARCHEDEQQRTYREILADDMPPVVFIEDARNKVFVEAIDTKLLAKALKKAGITRETVKASEERDWQAERDQRNAKAEIENRWRGRLFQEVRIKLGERFAESKVLAPEELTLLAVNLFSRTANIEYDEAEEIMTLWGHAIEEDSNLDDAISAFSQFLVTLGAPELCLFLIDLSLIDEAHANPFAIEKGDQPIRLLDQASRLGIDAEALRESTTSAEPSVGTSPPSHAAQAAVEGAEPAAVETPKPGKKPTTKKAKAKAHPAPAMPANEPAAPVKPIATAASQA